jgi:Uma2 family endonuclease
MAATSTSIEEKVIPKSLIYEVWDGKPVYYKGYKKVLSGETTLESVMGSSVLQTYIVSLVFGHLLESLSKKEYFIGTNEPGLHLANKSNFSNDIVLYRKADYKVNLQSVEYASTPPLVALEVDIKADMENFGSETDYFQQKTDKLLAFGVQQVVWITTASQKIMVAADPKHWEIFSWDKPVDILGCVFSLEALLKADGFEF